MTPGTPAIEIDRSALTPSVAARFWAKVDKTDGCWLWLAYTDNGYGVFRLTGRRVRAHRVSYELLVGPIPSGLTLDHLCRKRGCVNPSHLEPVTLEENRRRGLTFGRKTHCPQGHPYDEANTWVGRNRFGGLHRLCRTCNRESAQRRKAARLVAAA